MSGPSVRKSIQVRASARRVWEVLLGEDYTSVWLGEFSPGSRAVTDWQPGSKAHFVDAEGCGLVSEITANEPFMRISMTHKGVLADGREEFESEDAKSWNGRVETYVLTENAGVTTLDIEQELPEAYEESISSMWDKALAKIKELAEQGS